VAMLKLLNNTKPVAKQAMHLKKIILFRKIKINTFVVFLLLIQINNK